MVLKKQDNDVAYRLYQEYLGPYHLNSPKAYGYIYLFVENDTGDELFVIDWTQPQIGSVAEDLGGLYDRAPDNVKSEIIRTYREHIDFYQIEQNIACYVSAPVDCNLFPIPS